jgi:hypothetical protein
LRIDRLDGLRHGVGAMAAAHALYLECLVHGAMLR